MFEEKEERRKTFWHLAYWKQWMISDQVWLLGRGFSQTQHNGNISANDQRWCQKLTVEPTIQRDPASPPPHSPPLFELTETQILVPRALGPRYRTILFHLITPHVSIVSCQFPHLEAFQNTCLASGDHYPSLNLYFYFFLSSTEVSKFDFSCKVQAEEELMSWTRWKGLLAFILQLKKHLLSYHKMFLFSSKSSFGKTMRNGAWSEAGYGRDGMSRSLGRIFSPKKRWKKNGSQGLFRCWSMVIDGHLTDWNQTSFLYYQIKCTCSSNNKKMRNVSRLLYWFKTLQAILHNSWAFFTHFLTLRKPFSCIK